jgi:hypothetical protein
VIPEQPLGQTLRVDVDVVGTAGGTVDGVELRR